MRRALVGLLAGAIVVGGTSAAIASEAEAAKPPCSGRSVYVWRNDPLPCDVRPPQRLHVVGRVGLAACNHMGGRYGYGICWDVDY